VREDPDRLSIRTGLSNKKARAVQEAARQFIATESPRIEARRASLRAQSAEAHSA
jgi:hypothetical protein